MGSDDPSDGWLADLGARYVELARESAETSAHLAKSWGDRSLDRSDDWTIDTVTADAIEAWEHWTPLIGRGIDLNLELVQRLLRPGTNGGLDGDR